MASWSRSLLWVAGALLSLGILLRLTGLEVHSMWYDEGITLHVATSEDPVETLKTDRHPPVSFLAFRASMPCRPFTSGMLKRCGCMPSSSWGRWLRFAAWRGW